MLEGRRFFLVPHRALPDLQRMKLLLFCGRLVGPGEFRVRSAETKQSILSFRAEMDCFASLAMTIDS